MMIKKNKYRYIVAEMPFEILLDTSDELNDCLQQYEPFSTLDKTLDIAFLLNVLPSDSFENIKPEIRQRSRFKRLEKFP